MTTQLEIIEQQQREIKELQEKLSEYVEHEKNLAEKLNEINQIEQNVKSEVYNLVWPEILNMACKLIDLANPRTLRRGMEIVNSRDEFDKLLPIFNEKVKELKNDYSELFN